MAQGDAAAVHLTDAPAPTFAVGDRVMIRRNLDHPTWKKQVPADPRDIGAKWVRDPDIGEEVGEATIVDIWRRPFGVEVRATNGFWYNAETGLQVGSSATYITKLDDQEDA